MTFEQAVQFVLDREGGLVDHPSDPGGITNYGISLRAYPALGVDGIKNMSVTQARAIYRRDYWDKLQADKLPAKIRLTLFDSCVNMGLIGATRMLQSTIGMVPDGVIGPKTLAAALRADQDYLLERLTTQRILIYAGLKTFDTFGKGWVHRALMVFKESLKA